MEVALTPDQQALIRQAIESGRFRQEEDAVREALFLWEQRERSRADILSALDESEADEEAGRYADYTTETLPRLADELKHEGRNLRRRP